jgi:beta-barrel assembly-enhancing protease
MRSLAHLGITAALTISVTTFAQTPSSTPPSANQTPQTQTTQTPATQTPAAPATTAPSTTPASTPAAQTPSSTQPTPSPDTAQPAAADASANNSAAPANSPQNSKDAKKQIKANAKAQQAQTDNKTDSLPSPGEALDPNIKPGSEDDVSAVGTRNIGGRGAGNWFSTDWEIRNGKTYAMEIEKSAHMVTDPVIVEYVNRVGQNIVKNSDCKVPFTIKVIDSDEINAMALPGGFFYVNSGLIMAADEEAELAGVMAHETAHVCAHHAAREMTRMYYAQIGSVPLMIMTAGSWTGYGIYEAMQLAIPITFLQFSRTFEAEADWLGLQYMYKAGYDPQAFIQFFEKIDALEKHKPGTLAKVFADHPQTPDRILHSEEEIATIMPSRPDYMVTTSEFDDVKARLARIENKRKINNGKDGNKPTLRRASSGSGNNDPNNPNNPADSTDDRPTLGRRN